MTIVSTSATTSEETRLADTPVSEWTLHDALLLIPDDDSGVQATQAFFDGDHWQDGAAWIGPRVLDTDPDATAINEAIKRALVPRNVVREIIVRHVSGVVGREIAWTLTPTRLLQRSATVARAERMQDLSQVAQGIGSATAQAPAARQAPPGAPAQPQTPQAPQVDIEALAGDQPTAEDQERISEAEAIITDLWDDRGMQRQLQRAVTSLLIAGRAPMRLFVPRGRLDARGMVRAANIAEALEMIWLDLPDRTMATVWKHPYTLNDIGIVQYVRDAVTYVELCWYDAASQTTRLRLLNTDGLDQTVALAIGRRIPVAEIQNDALITEALRGQQRAMNLVKTMQARNMELSGFRERIYLNAQRPDEPSIGPATANFLVGLPLFDEQQQITGYTTPAAQMFDPVDATTFVVSEQSVYASMLAEAQQLHALISGDAVASGASRVQARADFEQSLLPTKAEVERVMRWLIDTWLAMAAQFAGQPGRYDDLRAVVTCRVDTGPLTSEEQAEVRANVDAGLYSRETGQALLRIDDPDAENARIMRERLLRKALTPPPVPLQSPAAAPEPQDAEPAALNGE